MHKGKGIVFTGCSHTWGGGLEFYPPFKNIPDHKRFFYDDTCITFAIMKFIQANRFSRLVADHFGMWEVNRNNNGGSDDGSIDYLKMIFSLDNWDTPNVSKSFTHFIEQRYDFDEIEYVIFQLTDPFRNNNVYFGDEMVYLNIGAVRYRDWVEKNEIGNFKGRIPEETFEKFFKFYSENFSSWEEMEDYFVKQNLDLIKKLFEVLEEKGVKCRIWTWQVEYVPFLKQDDYFNKRYIKLFYDNKEFDSLVDLMKYNPKFMISKSDFRINGEVVQDDHQTIECQRVTADSIIRFLENEQSQTTI